MSEDTARALGAGSPMTVTFDGKECQVRGLGIKSLTEAERECLKDYRRSYLETYAENIDLIPNGQAVLERKIEEAAKWDVNDLPSKKGYDAAKVKVTAKLKKFVIEHFDSKEDEDAFDDKKVKRFTAALLDEEILTVEQYKVLTGKTIHSTPIPYVHWWITGSMEGKLTMIWLCFKQDGITKQQISDRLGMDGALLTDISREMESFSTPAVGNG